MTRIEDLAPHVRSPQEGAAYDGSASPEEIRAKRLDVIAKAAFNNLRAYSNCSRSTLWALQTHLRLEAPEALKAATTLAGGIGETGETCGAVLGALMGIGLGLAPSETTDPAAQQAARAAVERFVREFTERCGSTRCYDVQEAIIGWRNDDPSKAADWRAARGPIACASLCAEAARLAADLILDEDGPN